MSDTIVGGNDEHFRSNKVPLTLADGSCGIRGPFSDEKIWLLPSF